MLYPGSLHNHTHISNLRLRDSTNKEKEIIDYAIELGHEVIGITEHEAVCNAVKLEKIYEKIKPENPQFKLIRGNEIYLCRNGLTAENFIKGIDKYWHFILLAKDAKGHEQIRKLSTRAWLRSYTHNKMVRVPTYYSDLEEIIGSDSGHVIASTACLGGFLPTKILQYKQDENSEFYKKILNWCSLMENIFGTGNFYLEMQPSYTKEQITVNEELIKLSGKLKIPYIITTDSHYLRKEDREIHKAFLTSQDGEREVDDFYASTYMMSTEELEEYFPYFSREDLDIAYENIHQIKEKCNDFSLLRPLQIPILKWEEKKQEQNEEKNEKWFAAIPNLKVFYDSKFIGDKILVQKIIEKLESDVKLQDEEIYSELNSNLEITWKSSEVNNTHWSAYFLNLQNIINVCWEAGTLVGCGRGSGVGFLLLYILGITQINPLWEETKTFAWRFLNPERVSVLDIDVDIEGGRRTQVLKKLKEYYGEDRVANVITFGTEGTKSAIQTAARGLGIDVDVAAYISSLVPSDRGRTRTLSECYYGDEEKGFKPIASFVQAMNENSNLWKVAKKIEGLICRMGVHAGGVVFVDEPFTSSTSLMRAMNGDIVTAFELHDAEECSLIKMDLLSVEALDKIHSCLDLLVSQNYIQYDKNLRTTYENTIGIYTLERENLEMWKMIWEHKIQSLFQMEKQSGIQGIALIQPKSVKELAVLNSVIRLMASEKGGEQPLNTWARYRKDITQWYNEMKKYGLNDEEIDWLKDYPLITDGMAESQEALMSLVQEDKLGGNSLTFADKCRKGVAKKQGQLFEECEIIFFKSIEEKGCSTKLAHYVWDKLLAVQRGYSFNLSHCLAYSLIALQEMNLCFKYPIIFWNCACLITNSGGNEQDSKGTDYSKTAQAMGKMISEGIKIGLPDINTSNRTFIPDVKEDTILYGLRGINNVGDELVETIIEKRPYSSISNFIEKVNPNKQAMIALIKGGCFDKIYKNRYRAMVEYLWITCDKKKRLTLQNIQGLIKANLLPLDTEQDKLVLQVYHFNKYLKTKKAESNEEYEINEQDLEFLDKIDSKDIVKIKENGYVLNIKVWNKIYDFWMDFWRNWIKENNLKILDKLNTYIFTQDWNKYASGNFSNWEMEALCFYYHEHELSKVNKGKYGIVDFFCLPEEPEIERTFKKGENLIPIYKLNFIAGTCIAKDKNKNVVYLLTTTGVVPIKMSSEYFSMFDRQISKKNEDGTKTVIEKSWFNRGSMLLVQGIRRGNEFIPKKYKNSLGTHRLYHIDFIDKNQELFLRTERISEENE